MISTLSNYLGKKLAQVSAGSDISKGKYSNSEIESILVYQITNFFKTVMWFALLAVATSIVYRVIGDIRYIYTTFISFIILFVFRRVFGGYHHNSETICLIISTIIPIACGYIALSIHFNYVIIIVVYVFSYITVFTKKVVDSPQKRFSKNNKVLTLELKERFFRLGVLLLVIITILHVFICLKGYNLTSNAITLSLFIMFLNLYFGK